MNRTVEIDHYAVMMSRSGNGFMRVITLTGKAQHHGIRDRAVVYFFDPGLNFPPQVGSANNTEGDDFQGMTVYAFLRMSEFDSFYRVLQSEKPVRFYVNWMNGGALTEFVLRTGTEPTGEGTADLSDIPNVLNPDVLDTIVSGKLPFITKP